MLQQVVQMDPDIRSRVAGIGTAQLLRRYLFRRRREDVAAIERRLRAGLQLDPNLTVALGQQITNRVERGELGKAYDAAQALVKSRPQSAQAHFALSYVFRYAGMLEQSAPRM